MKSGDAIAKSKIHCGKEDHHTATELATVVELEAAAQLLRAMADAARLRILLLLRTGEKCVTEIVTTLDEKMTTVSQRLKILRNEGLIIRRRDATHLYYALADHHVLDMIDNALAHAAELGKHTHTHSQKEDEHG